jgi:imidazolonepropionase-like amidohydrolase
VDSVDHASYLDDEAIALAKQHGTWLAMDIYNTEYTLARARPTASRKKTSTKERAVGIAQRESFRNAVEAGAKMVYATDSGVYPHGDNGQQFARMVEFGMSRCRPSSRRPSMPPSCSAGPTGWAGSHPAIMRTWSRWTGDPLADVSELADVDFVMKGGTVYRQD